MQFHENALLALSSGMLAGLGTSITLMSVPAIAATSDPLPVWKTTYNNGKNIALPTILVTTATGIRCYYVTKDWRFLLVSGLATAFVPWTLIFMKPINDTLNGMQGSVNEEGKVRGLIKKWSGLQTVRTALGIGAFVVTLTLVVKR